MKKLNNKSLLIIIALVSIILGMMFAAISFYEGFNKGKNYFALATSKIKDDPNVQQAIAVQKAFRLVVKLIRPTVVNISTETIIKSRRREFRNDSFGRSYGNDWFEFFFGPQKDSIQQSLGTGFIIDKDGYILTDFHVIENADRIQVKLANGKKYKAKIVGTDKPTDLALLKIDAKEKLEAAPLGDSDELQIGDWAIAIGNPFGLNHTFTIGIISAKGRSGIMPDRTKYENYIQTDAAINEGNSGGPLVNIKGEVIGINAAILSPSGASSGNVGIGFAIPINIAKTIFKQLKEKGKVTRGYLGVIIQDLTPEMAKYFNREPNSGVLVSDVLKKSAADKGGIENGDIIIEFNGKKMKDTNQLRFSVAEIPPGEKVKVKIIRDGKTKTLNIKLDKLPDDEELQSSKSSKGTDELWLGLKVNDIRLEHVNKFKLNEDETGVVITYVEAGSSANRETLRPGDIIKKINNTRIIDYDDYKKFIRKYGKNDSFLLVIKRKGRIFYLPIENEEE